MINRHIAPEEFPFPPLPHTPLNTFTLPNNIACYSIANTHINLIRMDIRIQAGSYYQHRTSVARACGKLLTEGTTLHSAEEIAEMLDYAGCYFETTNGRDFNTLSFYFPQNSATTIFRLVQEILTQATFEEDKINLFKQKIKNSLAINMEKTSYVGHTQLAKYIFGDQHPYGMSATMENIDDFNRDDILDFYHTYYHANNIRIFLAGYITPDIIAEMHHTLGQIPQGTPANTTCPMPIEHACNQVHIAKQKSVQSSIFIGKRFPTPIHSQWNRYEIVNTLLGGYFSSRLMTNIREDKGLAYGIYSRMNPFLHDGMFYIHADVNKQQAPMAVKEIYHEMDMLTQEPVSEHELLTLKNFMYGQLLRNFDGVFSQIDRVLDINDYQLPFSVWQQKTEAIKSIQASDIRSLAQEMLSGPYVEIVVG